MNLRVRRAHRLSSEHRLSTTRRHSTTRWTRPSGVGRLPGRLEWPRGSLGSAAPQPLSQQRVDQVGADPAPDEVSLVGQPVRRLRQAAPRDAVLGGQRAASRRYAVGHGGRDDALGTAQLRPQSLVRSSASSRTAGRGSHRPGLTEHEAVCEPSMAHN